MLPGSLTCAALVALALAVFGIAVHLPRLVTALTTAVNELPAVRLAIVQPSTWVPTGPVMLQPAVLVLQVPPPPAGSGSLIVTLVAVPGPLLVTTMVKVAVSPAVMAAPSGVL